MMNLQYKQYKNELREYLEKKSETPNIWREQLESKTKLDIGGIIISSVCGLFMMLGTSYLLVEAFSVVPLFSAIPFGALPFIVVPLAVLAGTAFGILTYNAIDEIIHEEIFLKRYRKIQEDLENGVSPWWIATKMFALFVIVGLAITLTICTGGTWWTVIKHTKPLFIGLSKIPAAVIGIIAGFLALASFVFNSSNALQTYGNLEEVIEDEVPDDNPYNIRLIEVDNIEDPRVNEAFSSKIPTIIKCGNKYYIFGAYENEQNWELIQISDSPFSISRFILSFINFDNKSILKASILNIFIYATLKFNNAHTFVHSKDTFWQKWNPIKIFLICTYLPLRILLFLGHLISISATSDRIPGIPEVLSMLIGLISEFFEDLHYFANLEVSHKSDLKSLIDERFSQEGGCNHENDLPTKILRDYIFYPVFYIAALWDNYFKDETKGLSDLILSPFLYIIKLFDSFSQETVVTDDVEAANALAIQEEMAFNNSLSKMMGEDIISEVIIEEKDKKITDTVSQEIEGLEKEHGADNDYLEDIDDIPDIEYPLLSKFSMFQRPTNNHISSIHNNCACHPLQRRG